jgi:2-oxo-4-hydroxy-4-carboxy--5-ureidoimidazoline (OHCU) decarboxylase
MLAIARARIGNSLETEIQLAAEEQRKITEIRLTKLLEK